jgi:uncharacterized membrane protein YjjP (DUF1212 family)
MKLKWPKLPMPTSRGARLAHFACAAFCVAMAMLSDQPWLAMLDCFLAGVNFAAGVFTFYQQHMEMHFAMMNAAFNAMAQLNNDLMAGKFEAMARGEAPDESRARLH